MIVTMCLPLSQLKFLCPSSIRIRTHDRRDTSLLLQPRVFVCLYFFLYLFVYYSFPVENFLLFLIRQFVVLFLCYLVVCIGFLRSRSVMLVEWNPIILSIDFATLPN